MILEQEEDLELDDALASELGIEGEEEPGGDELGGDELGGDELGGDELGGDELGGDELGGDELGGDEGGDELGGEGFDDLLGEPESEPESPDVENMRSGFSLTHVSDQLDGIVNNWFEFAIDMEGDEKEKFLALGERISEISDIIRTEYTRG
jgi:hypothetical protein